jgi:hypothetical protein
MNPIDMFSWLENEVLTVKTNKFHIFDPIDPQKVTELGNRFGPLPEAYRSFLLKFGEARLIRDKRNPWHWLKIFALRPCPDGAGDATWLEFGYFFNSGAACFKWCEDGGFQPGIFCGEIAPYRRNAESFEEWLFKSFNEAKRSYSKREWSAIRDGPKPFDARELQIVEAMQKYAFKKCGVSSKGNILIEVINRSDIQLPYLTIGVKMSNGLEGRVAVPVGAIQPQQSRIVEREIYKGSSDPELTMLFSLPRPEPEDREYYYEFGIPRWLRDRGVTQLQL